MNKRSIVAPSTTPEAHNGVAQAETILLPIDLATAPTAEDIRNFLPSTLNPQFEYLDKEKITNSHTDERRAVIPTYVTIKPVILRRVVGEFIIDSDWQIREAAVGQKYFEFAPTEKDEEKPFFDGFRLSVSNLMAYDLKSLTDFRDSYPSDTEFEVRMPVLPSDEDRKKLLVEYQNKLGLNASDAAFYEWQSTAGGAGALAGRDADAYFGVTSTDSIKPIQ